MKKLTGWPDSIKHRKWRVHLLAPGVLAVLGLLFFHDALFTSKSYYFRDILNFHFPLHRMMIASLAQGELPVWNPGFFMGQPMLANPNYVALYPINLLHLFLPFNYVFKLHFILHVLLGGIGLYYLQRRLGMSASAALGGAVAYEFSGPVLSYLNLFTIVPAIALLPWMGWALLEALAEDGCARKLIFGVLISLHILTLEPFLFLCTALFLGGLTLVQLLESTDRWTIARNLFRTALIAGPLALGLSAIQILPTMELLLHAARGGGMNRAMINMWSMHPLDLLNVVIPNLFGTLGDAGFTKYFGEPFHAGREGYIVSFFMGATAILLAISSLNHPRKKLVIGLSILALLGTVLALGQYCPVFPWLQNHLALLRLGRYPSKFFLLPSICLSILVSLGLESVRNEEETQTASRFRKYWPAALGLAFSLLCTAFLIALKVRPVFFLQWLQASLGPGLAQTKDFTAIANGLSRSVISTAAFSGIASLILIISRRRKDPRTVVGVFLLLLCLEIMPPNLGLSPLISDVDAVFEPEVDRYLAPLSSGGRARVFLSNLLSQVKPNPALEDPRRSLAWLTMTDRMSGQTMNGMLGGIQYALFLPVDGLNTEETSAMFQECLTLPETSRITLAQNLNAPLFLTFSKIDDPRAIYDRTFATQTNMPLYLYRLENSLPRAYFARQVQRSAFPSQSLQILISQSLSENKVAVLDKDSEQTMPAEFGEGNVRVMEYRNQYVKLDVKAKTEGLVVLLDSYYPGWQALLDGRETKILKANYFCRAVRVPRGNHQIEFRYRPRSFYFGLAISLFSLVLACCLPIILRKPTFCPTQCR